MKKYDKFSFLTNFELELKKVSSKDKLLEVWNKILKENNIDMLEEWSSGLWKQILKIYNESIKRFKKQEKQYIFSIIYQIQEDEELTNKQLAERLWVKPNLIWLINFYWSDLSISDEVLDKIKSNIL